MNKQKAVGILLCLMLCLGLLFASGLVTKAEAAHNGNSTPVPETTPDPFSLGIEPEPKNVPPTDAPPLDPNPYFPFS